jgi:hypothetical protein
MPKKPFYEQFRKVTIQQIKSGQIQGSWRYTLTLADSTVIVYVQFDHGNVTIGWLWTYNSALFDQSQPFTGNSIQLFDLRRLMMLLIEGASDIPEVQQALRKFEDELAK